MVWWLSLAAIVLAVVLVGLLATDATRPGALGIESYFQLPQSSYQLLSDRLGASAAELRNVSGQLTFAHPRTAFVLVGAAILAVAGLWWLTVLHPLGRLVGSVHRGEAFAQANAGRIQRIGLAVAGCELVRSVAEWAGSVYLKHSITARGLSLHSHFGLNIPVLLVGLLLIVLAVAFGSGAQLQQDHLTI